VYSIRSRREAWGRTLSMRTLYRPVARGELDSHKVGGRVLISQAQVDVYLARTERKAAKEKKPPASPARGVVKVYFPPQAA
jgi:excisionase family DNA binding protein